MIFQDKLDSNRIDYYIYLFDLNMFIKDIFIFNFQCQPRDSVVGNGRGLHAGNRGDQILR